MLGFIVLASSCKKKDPGPDPRDAYIGIYDVHDECAFDTSDYRIDIFKEGNRELIILSGDGLYNAGMEVEAAVSGNKIVIGLQRYLFSSTLNIYYEFSGNGNFDPVTGELNIGYKVLTIQDDLVIAEDNCIAQMVQRP